jgi:hypothetical protein
MVGRVGASLFTLGPRPSSRFRLVDENKQAVNAEFERRQGEGERTLVEERG